MKNLSFCLTIKSMKDIIDCYEYDISFYKDGEKYSGGGTSPTVEACFDDAMDYYQEITEGYIEDNEYSEEEELDDYLGFDEEGDQ